MKIKLVLTIMLVVAGMAIAVWIAWSLFLGNTAADVHLHDTQLL